VRRLVRALALCALATAPAAAALSVSAQLDRSRVASDEQLVLSVTVSGDQASMPEPKLPAIENFSVYDSGHSQSLSIINGSVSSSVVYTYVLTPRAVGRFRIPPIGADGAPPSAPIDVEVVKPGSRPAAPDPNAGAQPPDAPRPSASRAASRDAEAFITATLDKPRAIVNEQVTLTVRFLYADGSRFIGDQQYEAPTLTGFLTEDLKPVRSGRTLVNGRAYGYSEVKTALFPVSAGKLTIGSAAVHTQVLRGGGDPFSGGFFGNFFAQPQAVAYHSEPLTLQVDPPPPGKPADFGGLVGRLTAHASVDRTSVKAGDAVTLTIETSGVGNLRSVAEPAKPDLPSLRFFETETSAQATTKDDRVGGGKTFRTVVVPRVSGEVVIPAFEFSYYDPERKAYARAATQPITLNVAPGPAAATGATGPASAPGVTSFGEDVRYLKTASSRAPVSAALAAFADLGPWHALPFAALGFAALFDWRRRAAEADPRGRRFREARRRAEERLKQAAGLSDAEAARAPAFIDEALSGFIADKLGVPAAGLTLKAAVDGLKSLRRPPAEPTLARLSAAWEEANLRRFAPGGVDGADARRFASEIAAVIRDLDGEISS
jgi:hypothetical protein